MTRSRIGGSLDARALAALADRGIGAAAPPRERWRRAWLGDAALTPEQRAVLRAIHRRMQPNAFAQGNAHHLALGSGLEAANALRVLGELADLGWVNVERAPNSFRLSGPASAWLLIRARLAAKPKETKQ